MTTGQFDTLPLKIRTSFWLLVSLTLSPLYIYVHYSDYWSVWHSPPSIYTSIILTTGQFDIVCPLYIHTLFWLLVSLTLCPLKKRTSFWLLVSLTLSPLYIYVHYFDYWSVWHTALYIYVHYFDYWSVWHSLPTIYTYIILTTGQFDTLQPLYIRTLFWLLVSLTLSAPLYTYIILTTVQFDTLGPLYLHTLFWLLVSLTLSTLYIYVHYSDYWSVWHSLPSIYVHYSDYWSVWHTPPSIYTYIILTTGQFDTLCLYICKLFWLLVSLTLSASIYVHYSDYWSVWHSLPSVYTYIILTTGQLDTLCPLFIHTFWLLVSLTLSALCIYVHYSDYWSVWHSLPSFKYVHYFDYCSVRHSLPLYEGCPSKSWTFGITQDCVQVILWYFQDVFIYILELFCINMDGIAV